MFRPATIFALADSPAGKAEAVGFGGFSEHHVERQLALRHDQAGPDGAFEEVGDFLHVLEATGQ